MPRVLIALALLCVLSPSLEAAPILITSGTISGTNSGPVSISVFGEQFALSSTTFPDGGQWAVGNCDDECIPDNPYSLGFSWAGLDFPAGGVINGHTYTFGCMGDECGGGIISGAGSWVAPQYTGETATTIMAPFTLSGFVTAPPADLDPLFSQIDFYGAGIATINLEWIPLGGLGDGGWLTTSATYEITPAPVPEPASMALLGIGLAGLGAKRWRQRRNT